MREFFKNKVATPIFNLLKQGISPEKLALSLSAGVVICCFPILGTTSFLCFVFAAIFRLNHVAIQITNYVCYPLQFIFLIPLLQLGNLLFGIESMNLDIGEMTSFFQADAVGFLKTYGLVALRGCVAWLVTAPFVGILCYFGFLYLLKRIPKKSIKSSSY